MLERLDTVQNLRVSITSLEVFEHDSGAASHVLGGVHHVSQLSKQSGTERKGTENTNYMYIADEPVRETGLLLGTG